jgi:hypothetical protein
MHDKNVMLYLMVVYTCFKAGQLFLSRGAVNSIMIRLRAERHGVRIPGGPKTIRFPKRSDRLWGQSTLLINGHTLSSLEVKRPRCEFDH